MTHGTAYWLTAFRSLTAKLNELWCAVKSVTGLELLHLATQTQQTEEIGNFRLQASDHDRLRWIMTKVDTEF